MEYAIRAGIFAVISFAAADDEAPDFVLHLRCDAITWRADGQHREWAIRLIEYRRTNCPCSRKYLAGRNLETTMADRGEPSPEVVAIGNREMA